MPLKVDANASHDTSAQVVASKDAASALGTPARTFQKVPIDGIKIIQVGDPRSASTYQWYLLCSVLRLRYPDQDVSCDAQMLFETPTVQLVKQHDFELMFDETWRRFKHRLYFFASTRDESPGVIRHPDVIHYQVYSDFAKRGLASILDYQEIFSLSNQDTKLLVQHIRYWEILRKCCGSQQSIDNRIRLHNSSLPKMHAFEDYDYPNCEIYDLEQVERNFLRTNLSLRYPDGLYYGARMLGIKAGFCREAEERIRSGQDFNGRPWNETNACQRGRLVNRFKRVVNGAGKEELVSDMTRDFGCE
jgi:hypothetical protein